jgi:PAS domain S-box-containing protein
MSDTPRESEDRLARELSGAEMLQRISTELIPEQQPDALYARLLDAAVALLRSDAGSLQMLDPGGTRLRLLASRGFAPESDAFWQRVEVGAGSTCGQALRRGTRVVVPDSEACDFMRGTPDLQEYRRSGLRAAQTTPLIARDGRLIGMLSTLWRAVHEPAVGEFALFDVLARQAADLIERAQVEAALRASEERIRQLVALMPAGVYTCDAEGRLTFYNRRAAELWGREPRLGDEPEKFCGSFRMWAPDGLPLAHAECPMAAAVQEGRAARGLEVVIERPTGSRIVASVNIDPLLDRDGRPAGAINVFVDITDRKRAEQALCEREAWLRGQRKALEAALNGAPLESALGVLVKTATDGLGPDTRAAFYLANDEGTLLRHVVGMSADYARGGGRLRDRPGLAGVRPGDAHRPAGPHHGRDDGPAVGAVAGDGRAL